MKKIILFLLLIFVGCNIYCSKQYNKEVRITFIRCNNFPIKYMKETQIQLEQYLYKEFNIIAMIEWDDYSEYVNSKERIKGIDVINKFKNNLFPTTVVFIPDDIEYNKKGVLGLSVHPNNNVCVVSTYRLKNKSNLWKLVAHEFIHTYFDYSHCPLDCDTCIMKDAKGKVNFNNKNKLCNYCKHILNLTKINF